jgi:glycosyltransferase involved in cell wall biosynthesis
MIVPKSIVFKVLMAVLLLSLLTVTLAIGPYLPHPKRWAALANKQTVSYKKTKILETISIIVPTYNDGAEMLSTTIKKIIESAKNSELLEIIVVDGGSRDNSIEAIKDIRNIKIATSRGGRGPAINVGIKLATADILLMLHSDCLLEPNFDVLIRSAFADPKVIMTAFEFDANSTSYPFLKSVENRVSLRSRYLWLPYGDQGLAVRTKDLQNHFGGQIPNYKMMEDFEFVLQMRNFALDNNKIIAILPQKLGSSPRRFLAKGASYTAILNWLFVTAYVWGGATPDKIFTWYYS